MASTSKRGELSIKLGSLTLDLEFKSLNLLRLTENTGKTPWEYLARFDGVDFSELDVVARKVCDLSFVVPLVVAGLATNPNYRKSKADSLEEKVCKLIDAEAVSSGKGLMPVVAELAGELLPAIVGTLHVPGSEDSEEKNDKAPEAEVADGARTISVGDA